MDDFDLLEKALGDNSSGLSKSDSISPRSSNNDKTVSSPVAIPKIDMKFYNNTIPIQDILNMDDTKINQLFKMNPFS